MKRLFILTVIIALLFAGYTTDEAIAAAFTEDENGNIICNTGKTYTFVAMEPDLCYFGQLYFLGPVAGEEPTLKHLGSSTKTGMYQISGYGTGNILIRVLPDCEWYAFYRNAALPPLIPSPENCMRIEYVPRMVAKQDPIHTTCMDGITDPDKVSAFFTVLMSQPTPKEAGLDKFVKQQDGQLNNTYFCGVIYGYFHQVPNVAIPMWVTSYNDLAYSVQWDNREYVLPTEWLVSLSSM